MATKKKKTAAPKRATPVIKKSVTKKNTNKFWKVEFNVNTVYWMAIGVAVIATASWTYNTNQQITEIYDSIDSVNIEADSNFTKPQPVVPETR